jgi:hypothetical protein
MPYRPAVASVRIRVPSVISSILISPLSVATLVPATKQFPAGVVFWVSTETVFGVLFVNSVESKART